MIKEEIFKKNITTLRSKLLNKGAEVAAEYYYDNFREDGVHFNDGPLTSMTEVQGFIKSKEMLSAFEEDPLTPFGIIVRNVYVFEPLSIANCYHDSSPRLSMSFTQSHQGPWRQIPFY